MTASRCNLPITALLLLRCLCTAVSHGQRNHQSTEKFLRLDPISGEVRRMPLGVGLAGRATKAAKKAIADKEEMNQAKKVEDAMPATLQESSGRNTDPEYSSALQAKESLAEERKAANLLMSLEEVSIIEMFLKPSDIMLEWGAGLSTTWFSQFVKEYYSIEHDAAWFESTKERVNSMRDNVQLHLAAVESGHKGWGGGIEEGTMDQFESYVKAVDEYKGKSFDKVLIDGRARAACAEYILKFLHEDSVVFIHDFQERSYYHDAAQKFYNRVVETYEGQTVIVLRPKKEALEKASMAH